MKKVIAVVSVLVLVLISCLGYYFIPGIRVSSNVAATSVPAATNYTGYVETVRFTPVLLLFIPLGVLVVGLIVIFIKRQKPAGM